jgi:hypothetical protein
MGQRLATEYVKASLQLTEAEMSKFVHSFEEQEIHSYVMVLDNGNQEVVLEDGAGEEIRLPFQRKATTYVCETSCRLVKPKLTNAMRKAVSTFKGDAIVNRIYTGYTMEYWYKQGKVSKIVEHVDGHDRLVFEYKDTVGQLQQLFRERQVERQIEQIQSEINALLDARNRSEYTEQIAEIDAQLKNCTQQLFILEA